MNYTKRFEKRYGTLMFSYRIKWESRRNPADENRYWEYEDIDYIGVSLDPEGHWFGSENLEFDEHTLKAVTIFGIQFCLGHTWQCERVK